MKVMVEKKQFKNITKIRNRVMVMVPGVPGELSFERLFQFVVCVCVFDWVYYIWNGVSCDAVTIHLNMVSLKYILARGWKAHENWVLVLLPVLKHSTQTYTYYWMDHYTFGTTWNYWTNLNINETGVTCLRHLLHLYHQKWSLLVLLIKLKVMRIIYITNSSAWFGIG